MVATDQRLARLALTRLDAPCPVTWNELQRSSSVYSFAQELWWYSRRRGRLWTMAHVVTPLDQPSNYKDSQARLDRQKQNELLARSSTLYVPVFACLPRIQLTRVQIGNLSFYTTEEQIYELFSKCTSPEEGGGIKRIIMGLDRNTRCVHGARAPSTAL